jgi:hypothetical protein
MRTGIPMWELFSDPSPYAYGDPRNLRIGIQDLISHMGIIPVCIRLVTEISRYANGDHTNP